MTALHISFQPDYRNVEDQEITVGSFYDRKTGKLFNDLDEYLTSDLFLESLEDSGLTIDEYKIKYIS